ncbi:protein kinase domain-containing protein [Amphibacillus sp. Q70]|uniref:protein kinase domain-containing protein n=1 Tax=Amphibacillus sp. Q70 TaxID=3453416 RepID=UPI003F850B3F
MISDELLKSVSEIFIGDNDSPFFYKSGPVLVDFFNRHFDYLDVYQSGFPSRWWYVADKLEEFVEQERINDFFTLILSKRYVMKEFQINEVQAVAYAEKLLNVFNEQLQYDEFQLIRKEDRIYLIDKNKDLEEIGEGGFAKVYFRNSDCKVIKKLKDQYIANQSVCSRFKREYDITNSIQDVEGVIKLFNFDDTKMEYVMEKADNILSDYIEKNEITRSFKFELIEKLLEIMKAIHGRNIIHRDLSPTNILFVDNRMKIADFGLGKNYEVIHSHRTLDTNALGQYDYCAPEQRNSLKDGDKRSDVYAIGRIINFILNGSPSNGRHELSQLVNKATSLESENRFNSAVEMYSTFLKIKEIANKRNLKEIAYEYIQKKELSMEVIQFIDSLSGVEICSEIVSNSLFKEIAIEYMEHSTNNEIRIINDIDNNFRDVCYTFESNDPIALFATMVLENTNFTFLTMEKAAQILSYIAYSVNRFNAQRIIEKVIRKGIDPLLEEILR